MLRYTTSAISTAPGHFRFGSIDDTPSGPTSPVALSNGDYYLSTYTRSAEMISSNSTHAHHFAGFSEQVAPSALDNRSLYEQEQPPTPPRLSYAQSSRFSNPTTAASAPLPDFRDIAKMLEKRGLNRRRSLSFTSDTRSPPPEYEPDTEEDDSQKTFVDNLVGAPEKAFKDSVVDVREMQNLVDDASPEEVEYNAPIVYVDSYQTDGTAYEFNGPNFEYTQLNLARSTPATMQSIGYERAHPPSIGLTQMDIPRSEAYLHAQQPPSADDLDRRWSVEQAVHRLPLGPTVSPTGSCPCYHHSASHHDLSLSYGGSSVYDPRFGHQHQPPSPYNPYYHQHSMRDHVQPMQPMLSQGWYHAPAQQQQTHLTVQLPVPPQMYSPVSSEGELLPPALPSPRRQAPSPRRPGRPLSQRRANQPQLAELMHARTTPANTPGYQAPLSDVKPEFQFDIGKVESGEERRTTVMLKNIPNKMSSQQLVDFIYETVGRKIDFLYLRFDFISHCNVGYAFVNFSTTEDLLKFARARLGLRWEVCQSTKVVQMSFAAIQGRESLIEKFRNSATLEKPEEWRPKLFYSDGPKQGQPEPFPYAPRQWPRNTLHDGPRTQSRGRVADDSAAYQGHL